MTRPASISVSLLLLEILFLASGDFGSASLYAADSPRERKMTATLDAPLVGDYTVLAGLKPMVIEGVGLVVGLPGTGGNPAPSHYRTLLLEEMKRRQVKNPNQVLRDPSTALVIVRAAIPVLMKKGETVDVEVTLPESAEATSLAGGWLMETILSEHAFVPGQGMLEGHEFARARGPILTAALEKTAASDKGAAIRGRILGGANVLRERELSLFLKNEYRNVRNATRISEAISSRFHDFDEKGIQLPMAEAKTDQKIVLRVHPKYKDNYARYLLVVRSIAFRDTLVTERLRMEKLQKELTEPETSENASLQLEAIGSKAISVLKAGLGSPHLECRFNAAMALAYLNEPVAIPALTEAAREERAFRVFALAALSTLDDADAHLSLRQLMNEPSAETKYGAFRSLLTLDRRDPFLNPLPMQGRKSPWLLHAIENPGEPMVHLTTRTRPEVVLFGAEQKLIPPLYISAGRRVMVTAAAGAQRASVVRFDPDAPDQRKEVSLMLGEVIQAADELGATYPDVVQLLVEADRQKNLPGRLGIDEIPHSGRYYIRPNGTERAPSKARIGSDDFAPGMFPSQDKEDAAPEADYDGLASMSPSQANGSARETEPAEQAEPKRSALADSDPKTGTARSTEAPAGPTKSDEAPSQQPAAGRKGTPRNPEESGETPDSKKSEPRTLFGIFKIGTDRTNGKK